MDICWTSISLEHVCILNMYISWKCMLLKDVFDDVQRNTEIQNKLNIIPLPEEVYFMNSLPISFDYNMCFVIMSLSLFITIFSSFLPVKTIFDNEISNLLGN